MLKSRITKKWDVGSSLWLFQRRVAYLDNEDNIETVLITGWTEEKVEKQTRKFVDAFEND